MTNKEVIIWAVEKASKNIEVKETDDFIDLCWPPYGVTQGISCMRRINKIEFENSKLTKEEFVDLEKEAISDYVMNLFEYLIEVSGGDIYFFLGDGSQFMPPLIREFLLSHSFAKSFFGNEITDLSFPEKWELALREMVVLSDLSDFFRTFVPNELQTKLDTDEN